jgi:hypothetical protein
MFELTGTILERIIFAMEDQSRSMLVDMDTGELVERSKSEELVEHPDEKEFEPRSKKEKLQPPPGWTPQDGFKLMESFYSTLRKADLRLELSKALTKGKGVFKAFKEILGAWPEEEINFREFKLKFMRPVVQSWLDDYREWNGLSRLGPEPEDFEDILLTDFPIEVQAVSDLKFPMDTIFESAFSDSLDYLPIALARSERKALKRLIEENAQNCFCVSITGDNSMPIAIALGVIVSEDGNSHGKIRMLYVIKGYRNLEFPSLLLEAMIDEFHAKNVGTVLVDSLFLPLEFQDELVSSGYVAVGVRSLASRE